MRLEDYRRAHEIAASGNLGDLTEDCKECGNSTKLRDFEWTGSKVVCRDCAAKEKDQTP